MRALVLLVMILAASAAMLPAPPVSAANVTFTLTADMSGWNAGEPGGGNPTLVVSPGDSVTVTITWVNSLHNWALYPPGTTPSEVQAGTATPLQVSADVTSISTTASITFTSPTPGVYEYYCEYHPFTMHGQFIVDASPPTISAAAATPSSQTAGGFVNVSATVTDDLGLATVRAHVVGPSFDQNLTMANQVGDTWYVNRTYGAAGSYTFTIWATDAAGKVSSTSGSFSITEVPDTTAPTVTSVTANPSSQAAGGFVNVTATATDDVAVTTVWANVTGPSGSVNITMTRLGPTTWFLNRTYADPGSYTFRIWATDAAGHWGSSSGIFEIVAAPVDQRPADLAITIGIILAILLIGGAAAMLLRRRRPKPPST